MSHEEHEGHDGIGHEGHEEHEGINAERLNGTYVSSLRVPSALPTDLENLIRDTIGCCLAVHRELGAGLHEQTYRNALAIELEDRRLHFELERQVPVRYRSRLVAHHRIDLIVADRLIVEVKAVERMAPICVSQVLNYLHLTHLRAALLVNFNVPLLKHGIRRIVL
jgi:GxxExxY protein